MNEIAVKNLMAELGYKGMKAEYEAQLEGGYADSLSFNERLSTLLQAQYDLKRSNKIKNLHAQAKFALPEACMEDIDYSPDRELDPGYLGTLASCSFVANKENVIVMGASDCGKTYMGCALGNSACRHLIKTRYERLSTMFKKLDEAEKQGGYTKLFNDIAKVPLLVLDDFLVAIPTIKQVQQLLELVEYREHSGSTIVCTLLHPSEWQQRIGEKIQANSIYSRLAPGAHMVKIEGTIPMRERMLKKRKK